MIAIISDTHLPRGRRCLPEACVEAIRDADLVLHAGDVATLSALREIAALGAPLQAVCGNVDSPQLRRMLPRTLEIAVAGVMLGIVHDAGEASGRSRRPLRLLSRFIVPR